MAKALIISEKPSVGRDLAAALGYNFKRSGDGSYLESDKVIVSWAVGHLLRLANPDEYNEQYKRWRMEDLPIVPERFALKPVSSSKKQLQALKALLGRADVGQVVNACDAGREGELIFRYIMQYARCSKPVKRLWLASLTPEAIQQGLKQMRPSSEFDGLGDAARSRSEADWLVGMNASRAATLVLRDALGGTASMGRVQTPTLAILVRRELEIRDFKPEDYWVVEALFATANDGGKRRYSALYQDGKRMDKPEAAEKIAAEVKGQSGTITNLTKQQVKEKPPQLYDLTSLQREASNQFGWTAAKTLQVAQKLYEQHKLLTYPRTDSRWLPADQGAKLPELLNQLFAQAPYKDHVKRLAQAELPLKQVVNDSKVKDHYAIIPTGKRPNDALSKEEASLYDMVTRRLLAALSPPALVERTRVETTVAGHLFVSKGRTIVEAGWRAVYEGVKWFKSEEQVLPDLQQDEAVNAVEVEALAKQTQPPKRLSDASLLGAMETAGKLVDDDEAREAMKESGLGTPATRAAIIERLIQVEYVGREKKTLVPTEKGISLITLLGDHPLTSPSLTGDWERRLGLMAEGQETRARFMGELAGFSTQVVQQLAALRETVAHMAPAVADERESLGKCPGCGQPVREGAKSWSCWTRSNPGCGFAVWKTISGRKIPKGVVKELLTSGQTAAEVTGFKSKKGSEFAATLKLEQAEGKWRVGFQFADRN